MMHLPTRRAPPRAAPVSRALRAPACTLRCPRLAPRGCRPAPLVRGADRSAHPGHRHRHAALLYRRRQGRLQRRRAPGLRRHLHRPRNYNNHGDIEIALGNGDGTFQTPSVIPIPLNANGGEVDGGAILAKDFNGDGKSGSRRGDHQRHRPHLPG